MNQEIYIKYQKTALFVGPHQHKSSTHVLYRSDSAGLQLRKIGFSQDLIFLSQVRSSGGPTVNTLISYIFISGNPKEALQAHSWSRILVFYGCVYQ